jgi:ATP-binding cassette subfamily C protein
MTLLALASGGVVFASLAGQRKQALSLGRTLGSANRNLHGTVQESLAGIKLTKILGQENRHLSQFQRTLARVRQQQLGFAASTSLSRAFFQVAGAALLAAYLYLGLAVWQTSVPELLTLVLIFSRVIPLFMSAQQQLHHWMHALPALEETDRLLAECQAAAEPAPEDADEPPLAVREAIELDGVRLTYAERSRPALDGITLRLPVRTSTAIMGASGAGKSTLADVLMGLLEPDEGTLRVDGEPVVGAGRHAWRQAVAYVPQEVFLFNDSIRNNLLWGHAAASDEVLHQALQRAAADFVFDLPKGLETRVGDGGVRLSGGERQRLALARALLKQPSLLILDEATSALDRDNEERVRAAIEQLHGDLTLVVIGHRLATLEHADQVVVMAEGQIVQKGPWAKIRA